MATALATQLTHEKLLSVIDNELQDLPPLPLVVTRIMQTINDPKTSAADLNLLLSSDLALSGKVLRLVNSSYYGFPKKITTITYAIVILGFNLIRNLTTSIGVAKSFSRASDRALNRDSFWAHSVGVAVTAKIIAKRRNLPAKIAEDVFMGGLLHDIGKLFLDEFFAQQYGITLKLAERGNIGVEQAEKMVIGIGHQEVGQKIAIKWNLPPLLTSMVSSHHDPEPGADFFDVVAIVHAADVIASQLKLGNGGSPFEPTLNESVDEWLGFTPEDWLAVQEEAVLKFQEAKDFMSVTLS